MSRRSSGLIGVWAEAQRQQQRQREAQNRAWAQGQREQERQQRAQQRDMARMHREQQAAYRQRREADARELTEELEARVGALTGLLASGCRAAAFRTASLTRAEEIEPFAPGQLASPIPMPDVNRYPAQGGWTASRRAQGQQEAQARYQHDLRAAQAAEAQRLQQLATYRRQYDDWAGARRAEIRRHNAGVAEMAAALRSGEPDTVVEYFSAALYASTAWPEGLPRQVKAAFDPAGRQLVLNWELPGYDVVPEVKSVRYLASVDQDKESPRPATQRRNLYRDVLAQCVLLVLRDLFAGDEFGTLESVALNGFVDDVDPATGQQAQIFLSTVMVARRDFNGLNLEQVSAVDCLVGAVRGQLSARPDQRVAVRPGRIPEDVGAGVVSHGGGGEPDLLEMDPVEFEGLVAELFRARGMQAVTTQRSNDGGVDVEALDPDPISGGKIIVQVKRYRSTVPPSAVRDLYGTVQGAGANKGVLVTTSGFGPGSYTFASGKPLTLVSGTELVDLLGRYGLRGRLGASAVPAQRTSADATAATTDDYNVLGMSWSGGVALDVCALVCRGGRVLSDDHFVFFNNTRTPDGSVSAVPGSAGDKAAIRVWFDGLPERADRLVLVAAVDPEVNPDADLTGFTDAGIRLRDARGTELDCLDVSDCRAGETALVLGSFRRRGNGDWEFVIGGKGYPGGLEALVQDYGIEVG
ncbi:restriction endonuclease [Streptomyces lunaelactis]|uniref:restriction endonuclease n=1 Tax=Streptomyces lunaelactis TaxID=1535768 RepID=UPI0015855A65|nr:restriction endonuclease [Streptomyces lunaelactis]NUK53039.1 restriction endonuclease [Streptomyces lunaelactis]NUK66965.1 restriction endonuclease [Streptomyces lunaelactis]NUK72687.1 restriction endonuclease [Streptomyces lunaelactis]NUK78241.1 restriction endonuclease [Streptomyces lunaelactis]